MKVAVMGAGAIGSFFGGLLAEDENDVVLIARESHVKAIGQNGLAIEGALGKRVVKVKAVTTSANLRDDFDLVLLTVKAYDTKQAATEVKTLMGNDSVLLCLQNGLGVEQVASSIIGRDQVVRGVTINGVLLKEPGLVMHTGKGETIIGELHRELTHRIQRIAEVFSKAGLPTRVTNNIEGTVWTKTLINAGINPFGALTGMKNGELLMIPGLKKLMIETVIEGSNVAKKIDVKLEHEPVSLMINTAEITAKNKNSMLQDIERGKRTEIDFINGAILNLGKRTGIKTPLNKVLTHLVRGLESNRLKTRAKL